MHIAINRSGYGDRRDAGRGERYAQPGAHQPDECGPLRRFLDNVGAKSAGFAAGHRSVEGKWSHPARKEDEGLVAQIRDA